jgi:tRNA modification GTPase
MPLHSGAPPGMKFKNDDTIAAIATPPGTGGVAMIRVSGPCAPQIVGRLFRASGKTPLAEAASHRLLHGWIEVEGHMVDEVMAVWMKAPHSYTREDVVEVHCHGGGMAVRAILDGVCAGGARLAEAGEFTFRSFVNGRLDLTQVEAVADIVRAPSRTALTVSANQLRGRLLGAIQGIRDDVRHVSALVNASIDFPEEDVVFTNREACQTRMERARRALEELVHTADQGRILREGLAVAIVGKPNVGKSSLLNALLREERAIVTEVPGTTRDTVEEYVELDGLALRIVDTAGIRDTADRVEQAGIARSRRAIEQADLALLVLDGTRPLDADDRSLLDTLEPGRAIVVVNKRDLFGARGPDWQSNVDAFRRVEISALHREGLDELQHAIRGWAHLDDRPAWESALITNLRQKHAAERALRGCEDALRTIASGKGEELLSVDLSRVLDALGDIVGETTAEDLLDRIFADFCIGK